MGVMPSHRFLQEPLVVEQRRMSFVMEIELDIVVAAV
jgi:hypothetical protein